MKKTNTRIMILIVAASMLFIGATSVVTAEVPGVPIGFSVLAGDGYVELAWSEPEVDGGSNITGYRIYRGIMEDGMGIVEDVTDTHYTDNTIANGNTYYYAIAALNAEGEGEKTEILEATPGSSTPHMTTLILNDWTTLVSIIYFSEGVYLDLGDGGTHSLFVTSVTSTNTILSVSWDPQFLTMSEGDSEKIDVNGDGKYDFKITCDTITSDPAEGFPQTVKFSFTKKIGETESGTPGFELCIMVLACLVAFSMISVFKHRK